MVQNDKTNIYSEYYFDNPNYISTYEYNKTADGKRRSF